MRTGAATHRGQVRADNEDAFALLPAQSLFVVSDGMGGQRAGAAASHAVTSWLPELLSGRMPAAEARTDEAVSGALRDAIVELSRRVREYSQTRLDLAGMGATVVAALVLGERVCLAHMGDSRAYLLRQGTLSRLTEDHSVVALLLRHGDISPEEARLHSSRGKLSRYVGMEAEIHPDVTARELIIGDRLLLCTDGLTGMLDDAQLARLLADGSPAQRTCQALVEAANAEGGRDNVTALVLDVVAEED